MSDQWLENMSFSLATIFVLILLNVLVFSLVFSLETWEDHRILKEDFFRCQMESEDVAACERALLRKHVGYTKKGKPNLQGF